MTKFNLRITANTPVGKFVGYVCSTGSDKDLIERARDEVQAKISSLDMFTLYADTQTDGGQMSEITLPVDVIHNSVFVFEIVAWS